MTILKHLLVLLDLEMLEEAQVKELLLLGGCVVRRVGGRVDGVHGIRLKYCIHAGAPNCLAAADVERAVAATGRPKRGSGQKREDLAVEALRSSHPEAVRAQEAQMEGLTRLQAQLTDQLILRRRRKEGNAGPEVSGSGGTEAAGREEEQRHATDAASLSEAATAVGAAADEDGLADDDEVYREIALRQLSRADVLRVQGYLEGRWGGSRRWLLTDEQQQLQG